MDSLALIQYIAAHAHTLFLMLHMQFSWELWLKAYVCIIKHLLHGVFLLSYNMVVTELVSAGNVKMQKNTARIS